MTSNSIPKSIRRPTTDDLAQRRTISFATDMKEEQAPLPRGILLGLPHARATGEMLALRMRRAEIETFLASAAFVDGRRSLSSGGTLI